MLARCFQARLCVLMWVIFMDKSAPRFKGRFARARGELWFAPSLFIVLFGIFWALVYAPWGSESAPAWVQAIGSVLAIIGAVCLPIIHSQHTAKEAEAKVIGQLRIICEDCYEQMWALTALFSVPGKDCSSISAYLSNGRDKDWLPIKKAVSGFNITDIPPEHIKAFSTLQLAIEQSTFVLSQLRAWVDEGSSHPEIVVTLRARRDLLALTKASLHWPEGVSDKRDRHFQTTYSAIELANPPLEPMNIHGAKVYRRYSWDNGRSYPSHVVFQVVFQYGDEHPIEHLLEADLPPTWRTFDSAEAAVRHGAEQYIIAVANDWY